MSELDVIAIPPPYKNMWARRCVVDAWRAAGSPPLNWAGRTYKQQKYMYELWKSGRGNAADNPDAPTRQPHVRGMALDLAVWNAKTVKRMQAAGFTRPIYRRFGFSQDEPWHFELSRYVPIIRRIPKVHAAPAGGDSKPFEEDDMTPTQANQLAAVYAAMFGNRNITGKATETTWVDPWGNVERTKYGLLPIDIHTQSLVSQLIGQVAALTELVKQTAGGGSVNIELIEKAARDGAKDAIAGLTLKATND